MTTRQRIGWAMLTAPFVGLFLFIAWHLSLFTSFAIFGGVAAFVLYVILAADLI